MARTGRPRKPKGSKKLEKRRAQNRKAGAKHYNKNKKQILARARRKNK